MVKNLLPVLLVAACWRGEPVREPEFIYVRESRPPATCRRVNEFMRRRPAEPSDAVAAECAGNPYPDYCMYMHHYVYTWELRDWVDELVAACREDGDGPNG